MPSIPAELHSIIQDNLDVDEAMRLRQSGMNLPLFLTDKTLDHTLQRYETHAAADSAVSQADLETRARLYNQHKKGYPCKQIHPNTGNVGVWPSHVSRVLKGRFYGWESFGHESIRRVFIWDLLKGDFYKFSDLGDNVVQLTVTEDLVGFITPTALYTITIEDMLKHSEDATNNVHQIPAQNLRRTNLNGGTLISGEQSQIAIFASGEIKLYDYTMDQLTHIASEANFTTMKQFTVEFTSPPDDASDTSSDILLENGNIWLIYQKESQKLVWEKKPRTRVLEAHRFSHGEHKGWKLTYQGAPCFTFRHLRIRPTGLTDQWQIRTSEHIVTLQLSDNCKVVNVLPNNGAYVWKGKIYAKDQNNKDTFLISRVLADDQLEGLASIKGRNAEPESSQDMEFFVNEAFMVRSMHYGYFDPHDNSHEICGFSFDQMAEPERSTPLTTKSEPFRLVKVKGGPTL